MPSPTRIFPYKIRIENSVIHNTTKYGSEKTRILPYFMLCYPKKFIHTIHKFTMSVLSSYFTFSDSVAKKFREDIAQTKTDVFLYNSTFTTTTLAILL